MGNGRPDFSLPECFIVIVLDNTDRTQAHTFLTSTASSYSHTLHTLSHTQLITQIYHRLKQKIIKKN